MLNVQKCIHLIHCAQYYNYASGKFKWVYVVLAYTCVKENGYSWNMCKYKQQNYTYQHMWEYHQNWFPWALLHLDSYIRKMFQHHHYYILQVHRCQDLLCTHQYLMKNKICQKRSSRILLIPCLWYAYTQVISCEWFLWACIHVKG